MRKEEQKEAFREEYRLLGLKIAYYRKKRGYTQEQLADRWQSAALLPLRAARGRGPSGDGELSLQSLRWQPGTDGQ